jgi:hypothetical protein
VSTSGLNPCLLDAADNDGHEFSLTLLHILPTIARHTVVTVQQPRLLIKPTIFLKDQYQLNKFTNITEMYIYYSYRSVFLLFPCCRFVRLGLMGLLSLNVLEKLLDDNINFYDTILNTNKDVSLICSVSQSTFTDLIMVCSDIYSGSLSRKFVANYKDPYSCSHFSDSDSFLQIYEH